MKTFIFSHIADPDGITPIILSKLIFKNFDYLLLDNPLDNEFLNYVNTHNFDDYDQIFMIDLCINEDTVNKLSEKFKSKFLILDHHISNEAMSKYPFINVIDELNGRKESGTSLYYQYLLEHFNNDCLSSTLTSKLVDLVRLGDTWTFKTEDDKDCLYLADFLNMVGIDEYINYFYNRLSQNKVQSLFDDKLRYVFEIEEKRKQLYIEDKESQIISCHIKPYNVGVVFAESYRSSLGNTLATKYQDKYDFIIVINISRSISYRGIKDIDLSEFAKMYGGKGHKRASGSPIPDNLKEMVIKQIFDSAIIA